MRYVLEMNQGWFAKRGIKAWGIEYDRGLVEYAKRKAREAGVQDSTAHVLHGADVDHQIGIGAYERQGARHALLVERPRICPHGPGT